MNQAAISRDLLPAQVLADRVPFHLSPDGRWLAMTVQERWPDRPVGERLSDPDGVPPDLAGSRVVLVETATGQTCEPFPRESVSWAPQWSPDGGRLAGYVRHEGPACLAVWDSQSGAIRFLPQAAIQIKYGFETPLWLPDGRRIAAKLRPVNANTHRAMVYAFDPGAPAEEDWSPSPASGRRSNTPSVSFRPKTWRHSVPGSRSLTPVSGIGNSKTMWPLVGSTD